MFELKKSVEFNHNVFELVDTDKKTWLKVVPERGGIIIGFGSNGEEHLFLNEQTLADPAKNIRGGIPILFPISGQLENGQYEWNGTIYQMKNHGVARNLPWEVVEITPKDSEASIVLRLKSNSETKKSFPFDFEVIFTYVLKENTLIIKQEYQNLSDIDMPIYAGFHPYFKTKEKDLLYKTDAKTYLDYNDMKEKKIEGNLNLNGKKESFALLDAIKRGISFNLPDRKKTVTMSYGNEFKYVVLWTENDQDFVCVEPWMALTGELNRKEELVMMKSGEKLNTSLEIQIF